MSDSCCPTKTKKRRFDWLLWGSVAAIVFGYAITPIAAFSVDSNLGAFSLSVYGLMNKMWLGLVLAIIFVGVLNYIPRNFVMSVFGRKKGLNGILRATLGGLLLDLCSHGILLVGMKLYERGLSLGQVMAFLIASPWNSISITIVLFVLIGWKWTITFILLSAVVAIISGLIFNKLVDKKILPDNPNKIDVPEDFRFFPEAKKSLAAAKWDWSFFKGVITGGISESKMIMRWVFFGIVIASLMKSFLSVEDFQTYFGPTWLGLGITLVVATIIEVCSEGSSPIAAEILNSGGAPGNGFVFLMTGVATDYTEIMSIKERTGHWKIALFLPLVTVPQVIVIGWILNQ